MSEELNEVKLDSPLVVHHRGDASYQETASELELNETHEEEEAPTLTRHRFRKEKKGGSGKYYAIIAVIVIASAILCGLYYTDKLPVNEKHTTVAKKISTTESTTGVQEAYRGTIVIKDRYIFVDGEQVDGIVGMQNALKYVDAEENPYRIINENADGNFLNFDVLPMLMSMGFYDEQTYIEHKNLTGLVAREEMTEPSSETTSAPTEPSTDKTE